jgi:glycosyltransferase involved in cell wall biosynthesis
VITAIAVVVPARNEQRLLGACLASIDRAARHPSVAGLPVTLVVAADACRDRTVPIARRHGAHVLELACRSVGAARSLGTHYALDLVLGEGAVPAEQLWSAHTDADSQVPESWLADQLSHAGAGFHAVAGQVRVAQWSGHSAVTAARFIRHYEEQQAPTEDRGLSGRPPLPGHSHVHGANLGVRADAYLAVGGFPRRNAGEDHALIAALKEAGYRVASSDDARVITSARRDPRAPGGFGRFLLDLESRTIRTEE